MNGKRPAIHVSGWGQRRKPHHHSKPMTATMMPQPYAGPSGLVSPSRPSLKVVADLRGGGGATTGVDDFCGTSVALITSRCLAEYFGLQVVSVSCASVVGSTT